MADFADRSLGIGYTGGSSVLLLLRDRVACVLVLVGGNGVGRYGEHAEGGSVLLGTITFSQTLAPRWATGWRTIGRGLCGRRADFRRRDRGDRRALFLDEHLARAAVLAAFILTRPLGATVGDFLDKPLHQAASRSAARSPPAVMAVAMILCS